ncbi:hypothetical protein [Nocardiopsis halophila]|uniref:hypothetical protein n=1 Tax=Nocardiopsis halophila TaxID=141692 RepID=UPI0003473696|nr:hypothetical protein [Nocardiopsis halophila]
MYQPYDRNKFLGQVEDLLREAGLSPERQSSPSPYGAADQLLQSLGVSPVIDHVEALRANLDSPWPEKDETPAT